MIGRAAQRVVAAALMAALAFAFAGCKRNDPPKVVLYVSADEHIARDVIVAFQAKTGIEVQMVGDTEARKTTGLVERLRREADNPKADVFWSSEVFMTIELADEGVLDEHLSEATVDWPNQWRDGQRRWYGFAARARVIVYAPDRISPGDAPRTWVDLTDERYRNRIVMADPRFGTTGGHLAAMKLFWNRDMPGYYEAYLDGLAENQVRLLPSGNAGVVEAVANGEADLGMTDADDVWAARANGRNVDLVYAAHGSDPSEINAGTLLIPNTVARVKGGPNAEAAKQLIDFLLSEEVERMLAESVSHNTPLRPGLAEDYPQYAVSEPLKLDYRRAAALRQQAVQQVMKTVGAESDE